MGKIRTGDFESDLMPGLEAVTRFPQDDVELVDRLRLHQRRPLERLQESCPDYTLGYDNRLPTWIDINESRREIGVESARRRIQYHLNGTCYFDIIIQHWRRVNQHVVTALNLPAVPGAHILRHLRLATCVGTGLTGL